MAVYMKGRTLYVANSGDSRAVMAVDDGKSYSYSMLMVMIIRVCNIRQ